MKVMVGIPTYDNKLQVDVLGCLLTEQAVALRAGVELNFNFLSSCTNLAMGRNQIVKEFLASDNDKLVFLDADVSFEPGAMIRLALHDEEIVGGCYRLKKDVEEYPMCFLDRDEIWANEKGLIEVAMLPTGFLCIDRKAFEKFRDAYPGREYGKPDDRRYCFFQIPYSGGELYTEDCYFCREWIAMGGKIYLDPEMELTHWQFNIPYKGHIGNWLRSRMQGAA